MSITGQWYQSVYAPHNATGLVGGAINTSAPITGNLDEVFELGYSRFLGRTPYQRFRKIFFRNTGNGITEAVVYWQDSENREQMFFAFEKSEGDTSTNSATMPSGYTTGDFMNYVGLEQGVEIPAGAGHPVTGEIPASTGEVGLWIWQYIPNGLSDETGALATISIAGVVA